MLVGAVPIRPDRGNWDDAPSGNLTAIMVVVPRTLLTGRL